MPRLILIILLSAIEFSAFAQGSDIVIVKKRNGRTLKTFFEGTAIYFQTKQGETIQGPIARIQHDSIYVKMYTITKSISSFGSYAYDTLNSYLVRADYKDIRRVSVYRHYGGLREKLGALMMVGGAGYAALNLVNGSLFNLPITSKKNLRTLGISIGAFAIGFLHNKFLIGNSFSRKHDTIEYVRLH